MQNHSLTDFSEKKPLSLGFIGGSLKSAVGYAHFAASRLDNRWQLVTGCFSRDQETNLATGQQWNVSSERLYSSWQELITREHGKLDAIVILLPTPEHTKASLAALEAGHAVICEKSLATSTDEARLICDCAQKKNAFMTVTYNYSGYPMIRELKQIIAENKLGRIRQVIAEMPQESFKRLRSDGEKPQPQAWRTKDYAIPTISLDLGVHLHHLITYLTGEKALEVLSDQSTQGEHVNVIDNVMCMAKYTNEMRCQIWFSKTAIGYRNGLRLRIFGDTGSAEWLQENPEELHLNFTSGQRLILDRASNHLLVAEQPRYNRFKAGHPAGFIEAFANLYYDIADNLILFKQGKPFDRDYICNLQLALEGLSFFEASDRSEKNRAWEKINLTTDNGVESA